MDVGDVMDELGVALSAVTGLRVYPYWAGDVQPPAAIVGLPEIDFDGSLGRGADEYTLKVTVVVAPTEPRSARNRIGKYAAGSGADSVKAALEVAGSVAYDSARVTGVVFDGITVGGTEYLGATFTVDIIGSGS